MIDCAVISIPTLATAIFTCQKRFKLFLQFGAAIKLMKKLPALLREASTAVENAMYFCSKVFTVVENVLHFYGEVFTVVENVLHFCSSISTPVNSSRSFAGAFLLQYIAPAKVQEHFYAIFWCKIVQFVVYSDIKLPVDCF